MRIFKLSLLFAFLISMIFLSCNTSNHIDDIRLQKTTKTINDIFEYQDSVILKPFETEYLTTFAVNDQKQFIIADYSGKKVQLLNRDGTFLKDLFERTGKKSTGSPLCITIDEHTGKIFISDNSNRRIHILDSNFNIIRSFIIPEAHMAPVSMKSIGGKLYMSGYSKQNKNYIHIYDTMGRYLKRSFLKDSKIIDDENAIGVLNYVHFDTLNNKIYTIELMNYLVSIFNDSLDVVKKGLVAADYFKPLDKYMLKNTNKKFEEVRGLFSKPSFIASFSGHLFIFSEMPSVKADKKNYYNTRNYNLDIFDPGLEKNTGGIVLGNMMPMYWRCDQNLMYFLSGYDPDRQQYTVKIYSIKQNAL